MQNESTSAIRAATVRSGKPLTVAIWAAFVAICLIWGSSFLAIRFAIETLPPFLMAGTRSLAAGTALFVWRCLQKDPLPNREEWRSAATVGILLMVAGNGGLVWAEQWVDSGIAALLHATVPLWIIVMDAVRLHGRPTPRAMAGVVVGFVGLIALLGPGMPTRSSDSNWLAIGVVMLSAIAWAAGSLYSRDARLPKSPIMGTSIAMLAAGVGLSIIAIASGELGHVRIDAVSLKSVAAWGYMTVFGNGIAFISYTWLLRAAPTSFVSMYMYVNPVVALLLGHWLAAEALTLQSVAAAVIIIGAVAFTTLRPSRA
jgi:drug/metabolite transporter (DMT)-like permease